MGPKTYTQEWRALQAARVLSSMWPGHRFSVESDGLAGYVIYERTLAPRSCYRVSALQPLPFSVSGTSDKLLVYAVVHADDTHGRPPIAVYPTWLKARNHAKRLGLPRSFRAYMGHRVRAYEFIGPLQPHIARRVSQEQRELAP